MPLSDKCFPPSFLVTRGQNATKVGFSLSKFIFSQILSQECHFWTPELQLPGGFMRINMVVSQILSQECHFWTPELQLPGGFMRINMVV